MPCKYTWDENNTHFKIFQAILSPESSKKGCLTSCPQPSSDPDLILLVGFSKFPRETLKLEL